MNLPADPGLAANLAAARAAMKPFLSATVPHFIAGQRRLSASGETFETLDPATNERQAVVAAGGAVEIDLAAQAARKSFPAWSRLAAGKRRDLLHAIADRIAVRAEEIALVESSDTGQPIRYMAKAALRGADNFRFFADRVIGARDGLALPDGHFMNYTTRQPIGPVGVITPWNTPFMLSTWKIAPALAAGCTIVHKPAEWSPLSAVILVEIMERVISEAGLPSGVVNLVQGVGERTGKALTEHPDIRAIAFIGESATGSLIMSQAAPTLKRLHFELGGKNPVIIFADADLDRALDAVLFMIYSLNGERCTSSSRALIERSIHEKFLARLVDRVRRIKVGPPLDPMTEIGPLIHPDHAAKVLSYPARARAEGVTVLAGGGRALNGLGNYVEPTIYASVDGQSSVAQEEIFGPHLTVIPFDDEAEALRIANGVKYGLTAYIWTQNVGRAHRLARDLEAGMIWVNSDNVRHLPTPFGGMKQSGIGRDGGDYSFDFYMETKNVAIAYDTHSIPRIGD